jgi:hypothetical protein
MNKPGPTEKKIIDAIKAIRHVEQKQQKPRMDPFAAVAIERNRYTREIKRRKIEKRWCATVAIVGIIAGCNK